MLNANIKYLGFDDRKFMLWGIVLSALLTPVMFLGVALEEYPTIAHQKFPESLMYCSFFWLWNRWILIKLRMRYHRLKHTMIRFFLQLVVILVLTPFVDLLLGTAEKFLYAIFELEQLCKTTLLQGIFATVFISFAVLAVYEAIYFFHKYKEVIVEKEQIQQAHIQSQLDNLRNQINPHFLFNSLNTLMNLIPANPDRAMIYLNKLSKFYRYAVGNRTQASVSVQTELENLKIYADLLRERFAQSIDIELPTTINLSAHIPPLSLQMLLENAIKHNIVSKNKPLNISVTFDEEGDYVWVRNNIQKKIQAVESTGMGLSNIKKRLSFFTPNPVEIHENDSTFVVGLPLLSTTAMA